MGNEAEVMGQGSGLFCGSGGDFEAGGECGQWRIFLVAFFSRISSQGRVGEEALARRCQQGGIGKEVSERRHQ